tara:strand:+ start:329 stop:565 length:237 start_codon:yes stop_codon:yes gene_type:complete
MGKCIEGFTNIIFSDNTPEEKNELMKLIIVSLLVKLLFIYLVARFLWPYVMPKLFKSVKANPTFLEVLALSVLISLIS